MSNEILLGLIAVIVPTLTLVTSWWLKRQEASAANRKDQQLYLDEKSQKLLGRLEERVDSLEGEISTERNRSSLLIGYCWDLWNAVQQLNSNQDQLLDQLRIHAGGVDAGKYPRPDLRALDPVRRLRPLASADAPVTPLTPVPPAALPPES